MKLKTREMVEISAAVALAFALSFVKIYQMPQGGSISLEMVPIIIISLRRGVKAGVFGGIVLGILKLLGEFYVIHPIQLVMDYPMPFAVLGLAGFFRFSPILAVLVGGIARYAVHVIAGAVFWGSYAPEGTSAWVYSLGYNASYMVPEVIIAAVVVVILWRQEAIRNHEGISR